MLVNNPCVSDARVLRAARCARDAGFETIVLAHGTGDEADVECIDGFLLCRRAVPERDAPLRKSAFSYLVRRAKLWLFQTHIETRAFASLFESEIKCLNPDVIHAHDLATLPAATAAATETGAALIYDAHELEAHRMTRAGFVDTWLRRRVICIKGGLFYSTVTDFAKFRG